MGRKFTEKSKGAKIWDVEELIRVIKEIGTLYGTNKEMVQFLINNFKREVNQKER